MPPSNLILAKTYKFSFGIIETYYPGNWDISYHNDLIVARYLKKDSTPCTSKKVIKVAISKPNLEPKHIFEAAKKVGIQIKTIEGFNKTTADLHRYKKLKWFSFNILEKDLNLILEELKND